MNRLQKKVFTRVFGTHLGIVFLLLFVPWIKGCFKPKEIITYVDLTAAPPSSSAQEMAPEPEPEPKTIPKPEPKPEPKPVPKPKAIPEPPKTNPPPKIVKAQPNPPPKKEDPKPEPKPPPKKTESKPVSKKPEPKPAPKPAPKQTEAERLAAIRQNNPVSKPSAIPSKPLDLSSIKSALNNVSTTTGTGSGSGGSGAYSPFAGYYDSIKQRMYAAWQQPSGAPIGLTAVASIRVESDGAVSSKTITRRSGNAVFDLSVQNALNATTRMPVPPADLPSRTIEIEFELSR